MPEALTNNAKKKKKKFEMVEVEPKRRVREEELV